MGDFAAFSADKTNIDKGDQVSFNDQSDNDPTSWSWNFGDGGSSSMQHPSYSYASAGVYSVTLTVTNKFGSDSETKSDFITVNEPIQVPVAAFTADRTNILEDETVSFTDQCGRAG